MTRWLRWLSGGVVTGIPDLRFRCLIGFSLKRFEDYLEAKIKITRRLHWTELLFGIFVFPFKLHIKGSKIETTRQLKGPSNRVLLFLSNNTKFAFCSVSFSNKILSPNLLLCLCLSGHTTNFNIHPAVCLVAPPDPHNAVPMCQCLQLRQLTWIYKLYDPPPLQTE